MRNILIQLLLLILPLAPQAEVKSWKVRVTAIDIAGDQHTLWLRMGSGKQPVEMALNTRIFSLPIEFKGAAELAFYRSADEAKAEEPPEPVCTALLGNNSSLLIFAPTADGKKYNTFSIAETEFPFGSFRLVNLSDATVRADFSGNPTILKPKASATVKIGETGKATPVRILATADNAPSRLIRQSSWSIVPTQRELVLFLPNNESGLVTLRHFVDTETKSSEPPQ